MPITFGELIDELLDARRRHGNELFLFTPLELDLCIECALELRAVCAWRPSGFHSGPA